MVNLLLLGTKAIYFRTSPIIALETTVKLVLIFMTVLGISKKLEKVCPPQNGYGLAATSSSNCVYHIDKALMP